MVIEIGIIGGSGLYDIAGLSDREDVTIETPFGPPMMPTSARDRSMGSLRVRSQRTRLPAIRKRRREPAA